VPGIGDEIGAHLLAALQFGDIVQGQDRRGIVKRRAVELRQVSAQHPLDRHRQGELDAASRRAGQDCIGGRKQ